VPPDAPKHDLPLGISYDPRPQLSARRQLIILLATAAVLVAGSAVGAYHHYQQVRARRAIKCVTGLRWQAPVESDDRQKFLLLAARMGPTSIEGARVQESVSDIVAFKDFAHWGPYRHPLFPDDWGLIIFWVDFSSREYWIAHHPDHIKPADWIAGPFDRPWSLINTEKRPGYRYID
jgi:hypothetical protein